MSLPEVVGEFWGARSGRERAILSAGTVAVLVAALYAFLWEPGLAARKKLAATLPVLRAQVEDMRRQQHEIAALRKKIGAAAQPADLKALLEASVARGAPGSAIGSINSLSAGRARMVAASIEFDAWLGWVETLQRDFGVRIEACQISALDGRGRVRVEANFVAGGAQ